MLCGCSKYKGDIKPILSGISFTANISFYNEEFVCDGWIDKEHTLKLIVKEPENIEGMTICSYSFFECSSMTSDLKGMNDIN